MISYYCHITNYPGFVFHPPPTSLNQLGGLGSAVSCPSRVGPSRKHVCDILNKENAAGDNKTIYIFYIRHSSERSGTIVSSRPKKSAGVPYQSTSSTGCLTTQPNTDDHSFCYSVCEQDNSGNCTNENRITPRPSWMKPMRMISINANTLAIVKMN